MGRFESLFLCKTGNGIEVYQMPNDIKEAESHFAVVHGGYKSFPDFVSNATDVEKLSFWRTVGGIAADLARDQKGGRIGCYNFNGQLDEQVSTMFVEVVGGENLGQKGKKGRWFENPEL